MTTLITAQAQSQSQSQSQSLFAIIARIPNPLRILRALEQLNKFRALDAAALHDMGLSRAHASRATLADFMAAPQR